MNTQIQSAPTQSAAATQVPPVHQATNSNPNPSSTKKEEQEAKGQVGVNHAKTRSEAFAKYMSEALEHSVQNTKNRAEKLENARIDAVANNKLKKAERIRAKQEKNNLRTCVRRVNSLPSSQEQLKEEFKWVSTVARRNPETGEIEHHEVSDGQLVRRSHILHSEKVAESTSQFCSAVDSTAMGNGMKAFTKVLGAFTGSIEGTVRGLAH